MQKVKAVLTAIVLTAGSAGACAAADIPIAEETVTTVRPPLRLSVEERRVEHRRLACNAFGRCFREGPFDAAYGPIGAYPGPRVYAPPIYEVPEYEVRRTVRERRFVVPDEEVRLAHRERRFEGGDYEERRTEEDRRSFTERRYHGPDAVGGRPFAERRFEDERPRERWSRDERRDERDGEAE